MSCIICDGPNPCGGSFCASCEEREYKNWIEAQLEQAMIEEAQRQDAAAELAAQASRIQNGELPF